MQTSALMLGLLLLAAPLHSQKKVAGPEPLRDVHVIKVDGTVVALPDHSAKIDDVVPNLIQDNLRSAVRNAGFDIGDSTVSTHFVLEEFSSGNTAARFLIGLGAGRSSITGHLILQDANGKELANVRLHVNGSLDAYQKSSTQRRDALSRLQQAILEQLEMWK
jgi:hypothetical protein